MLSHPRRRGLTRADDDAMYRGGAVNERERSEASLSALFSLPVFLRGASVLLLLLLLSSTRYWYTYICMCISIDGEAFLCGVCVCIWGFRWVSVRNGGNEEIMTELRRQVFIQCRGVMFFSFLGNRQVE